MWPQNNPVFSTLPVSKQVPVPELTHKHICAHVDEIHRQQKKNLVDLTQRTHCVSVSADDLESEPT